jgi:Domain of unknown function (DUF4352)
MKALLWFMVHERHAMTEPPRAAVELVRSTPGPSLELSREKGQAQQGARAIKNIGSETQQFDDSAQYFYTSDGKQLSYASDGTTAANSSGSQCNVLPTINPGNSLSCNVAVDVPRGVTPTRWIPAVSACPDDQSTSK